MKNAILLAAFGLLSFLPIHGASAAVHECETLFLEDTTFLDQTRLQVFVRSEARSRIDRAETAAAAAYIVQNQTNYKFVQLILVPAEAGGERDDLHMGTSVAWARFAPDPSLVDITDEQWEVSATDIEVEEPSVWITGHEDMSDVATRLEDLDMSLCLNSLQLPDR